MYKYTDYMQIPTNLDRKEIEREVMRVDEYYNEGMFILCLSYAEDFAKEASKRCGKHLMRKSRVLCESTASEYVEKAIEYIATDIETRAAELQLIDELKHRFGKIKLDYDPLNASI